MIFISSAAVHLKENSNYKLIKLLSENIIKDLCKNYTIIRPSAILGPNMRPNSLIRIIDGFASLGHLSGESMFNYVLQSDIADFIDMCIRDCVYGTYEFVSNDMITLNEIAIKFGKNPVFGEWKHKTPFVNNQKTVDIFDTINKSSWDVVNEYLESRNGNKK